MVKRTSIVNSTRVNSISLSSVFQIGDSVQITPRSWALAVQRQLQLFYGDEGDFAAYPIFTREIQQPEVTRTPTVIRYNASSIIKVSQINLTALSASSVYHIGSTSHIHSESRIKHIRQIEKLPEQD
jgi:spore germination protein PE